MQPEERSVTRIVPAQPTSDGAGVKLARSLGTPALDYLDPFLLLDEFKSDLDNSNDCAPWPLSVSRILIGYL